MKKIILASASPRRRELLAGLDLDFTVDTSNNFQEIDEPGAPAHRVPVDMALGKSAGFHRPLGSDEILITADTVVIVDGDVLGKPRDREDAVRMLRLLSGRDHEVVTAVVIRDEVRRSVFSDTAIVHFAELRQDDIDYYIDRYKPFDKAGAYGIQEWIGYAAIKSIEGSFYTVMGFPVQKVWAELQHFL